MKFWLGLYGMQSPRSFPRSLAWSYSEVVRHAIEAEKLGFDGFGITEHHFWYDGYCPSLFPVLAAIARRTNKIGLLTGALLPLLRDPLLTAQEMARVDQLSRGRLLLGLGYGYRPEEYEGFGLEMNSRGPRYSEAVEVLRLAFSGEPFSFDGKYYNYQKASISPGAFNGRCPPMWLAGGGHEATARRAARLGLSYWAPGSGLPVEQVELLIKAYKDTWHEVGHPPELARFGVATDVAIAESAEQAEEIVTEDLLPVFAEQLAGFGFLKDDEGNAVREIPDGHPIFDMLRSTFCTGTPDQVIESIEAYHSMGCNMFMPRIVEANFRSERILAEMKLFAEKVIPHFNPSSAIPGGAK
jgi:alkanesulfonate monooxygenase SsuD/methylene tetrahydromethanopterin reductase-like flavin-dependent oxidoreductase (luciferase family)